jgi:hypothetical protein
VIVLANINIAGMTFNFKFTPHSFNVPEKNQVGGCDYHLDGLSGDMSTKNSTMSIVNNRSVADPATKPFQISYTSDEYLLSWHRDYLEPAGNKAGFKSVHKEGECKVSLEFKGYGQWVDKSTENRPNMLGLDFTFDSTLKPIMKPVQKESTLSTWWSGFSNGMPPGYENLNAPAPKFDLQLASLDWFLTTNLLFPGLHVFRADPPVAASASSPTGLATPRDTILTGKLEIHNASKQLTTKRMSNFASQLKSVEPDVNIINSLAIEKGADSFKEEIISFPKTNLLTDIIRTFSSSENTEAQLSQVLTRYGYSALEEFDFFSLLGTSVDQALSRITGDSPASNVAASKQSIDLRMYGGVYIVEEPSEDAGKRLYVNALKSTIIFAGASITPTQTFDEKTSKFAFEWKQADSEYSLTFDIWYDPDDFDLNITFSGTKISSIEKSQEKFAGKLYGAGNETSATSLKREMMMAMPGSIENKIPKLSDLSPLDKFQLVASIFGVTVCVVQCTWPCIRKIIPDKVNRAIDKCNASFRRRNTALDGYVEILIEDKENFEHEKQRTAISDGLQQFENEAGIEIDANLKTRDRVTRETMNPGHPLWDQYKERTRQIIENKATVLDTEYVSIAITGMLSDLENTNVIDTKTRKDIHDKLVKKRVESTKAFMENAHYYETLTAVMVCKDQEDLRKEDHAAARKDLDDATNVLQKTENEIEDLKTNIRKKEDEISKKPEGKDKTDLEDAKKQLERDLQKKIDESKDQDQNKRDQEQKERDAEHEAKESEDRHKEAQDKAKEARDKVLE